MFGSNCAGSSCSLDSDCSANQVCCHSKCVLENRCIGERCVLNSYCRANQECCNSVCVSGKSCSGRSCSMDSDCSANQVCCHSKCVQGSNCFWVKDARSTPIVPLIKHVVTQNASQGKTVSHNVVILTPTVPEDNLVVVPTARMV